jgi:hypothetical protein
MQNPARSVTLKWNAIEKNRISFSDLIPALVLKK